MSIDAVVSVSQQLTSSNISARMEVAAAKRNLDQQKLVGQAALKLMDAAAVSVDPNLGQNIDIQV
jgi:hypothetical protein